MATGKYLRWKDSEGNEFRPVSLTGMDLLNDRNLNKGTAFSEQERADFELDGLLPPQVQMFDDQIERVYQGFESASTDIEKYIFCARCKTVTKRCSTRCFLSMWSR
ncbi:hypothetical protein PCI56_12010 [Plesiomonas shigelloides subsp. oncorhynchi]|nr:hypothetical protein [Plesiomonas shigelloides]